MNWLAWKYVNYLFIEFLDSNLSLLDILFLPMLRNRRGSELPYDISKYLNIYIVKI